MTIYALSSGPGISGIAVIRISGKEKSDNERIINETRISINVKPLFIY